MDSGPISWTCASEDADHEVVELRAGPEKEAALGGAAGDLDEGPAFGGNLAVGVRPEASRDD